MLFGPDPSSGDMCKLGGMVANNSSGPHTLRYGAVKDNVRAFRVCLQSGEWLSAAPWGSGPDVEPDFAATVAEALLDMVLQQRDLIDRNVRRSARTVAGTICSVSLMGLRKAARSSQTIRRQRGHTWSLQRSDHQASSEAPRDPHSIDPFSSIGRRGRRGAEVAGNESERSWK